MARPRPDAGMGPGFADLRRGFRMGLGFVLAIAGSSVIAISLTGTLTSFSEGDLVSAATLNENFALLRAAVEKADEIPAGMIAPFSGATVPDGWLLADGRVVARESYPELFAAIGTTYGAGDGSTTFQLPDLRGEFLRGLDQGRLVDTGRALGSAQADQIQSHRHIDSGHTHSTTLNQAGWGASFDNGASDGSTNGQTGSASANLGDPADSSTGAGTARHGNETRPRNVAVQFLIKY